MASIIATADASQGLVRVDVDSSALTGVRKSWISRTISGATTLVREGNPARLSAGRAVLYDVEVPLDTVAVYSSRTALNRNGDFEDDIYDWVNARTAGCTLAQSFSYWVPGKGRATLQLVPTGGVSSMTAFSELVTVSVGQVLTLEGQILLTDYWSGGVALTVSFYTGGGAFISSASSPTNYAPVPGQFESTIYSFSATAPATTATAAVGVTVTGTPPSTLGVYLDEVYMTSSPSSYATSSGVSVPGNGGGWLKDPLHPAANVPMLTDVNPSCTGTGTHFLGFGDITRPADSEVNEVAGSTFGIGNWSARKARRSSLGLATRATADRQAVEALTATGAPLLIQTPPQFGDTDHYGLVDDVEWGRLATDQTLPWRLARVPYVEQPQPVGPAEGVLGVRYADLDRYDTWAQFTTAGLTWLDAMQGKAT